MAPSWRAPLLGTLLLAACSSGVDPVDAGLAEDASAADAELLLDAGPAADAEVLLPTVHTYVALGSSSTAGSGATAPDRAYVERLAADLRERAPDLVVINLARGGATVDVFLAALDRIRAARPELVTILPFTDYVATSTTTFRDSYAKLLDELGAVGATVFFGDLTLDPALVCGVGRGPGGCYSTEDQAKLGAKSAILAELAGPRAWVRVVPVLDQNVAHPEWIATDGAHPNDLGHEYLAATFWVPIAAWLDWPQGH